MYLLLKSVLLHYMTAVFLYLFGIKELKTKILKNTLKLFTKFHLSEDTL